MSDNVGRVVLLASAFSYTGGDRYHIHLTDHHGIAILPRYQATNCLYYAFDFLDSYDKRVITKYSKDLTWITKWEEILDTYNAFVKEEIPRIPDFKHHYSGEKIFHNGMGIMYHKDNTYETVKQYFLLQRLLGGT